MTTQSALIVVGIVLTFATFGIALAWADFYTQSGRKRKGEVPLAAKDDNWNESDERRAA